MSDYSGWGGDDKGAPMVVVSENSSNRGGGGMVPLLVTALVISLGLAAASTWMLIGANKASATAVAAAQKDRDDKVGKITEQLGRAKAALQEDKEYADALRADNDLMRTRHMIVNVDPPTPPARQQIINELQTENKARRAAPKSTTVKPSEPRAFDPWDTSTPHR